MSPKYLFSLECFTETLPLAQSDTLWENIQFLREPNPEQEDSPHVFTLSGCGQEGSAIAGQPAELGRRLWTCWCAMHRPQMVAATADNAGGVSTMIILEFELERDTHNPLYPVWSDTPDVSGGSSPSTQSLGENSTSTDGSDRTLVSREDSTPIVSLDGAAAIIGTNTPEVAAPLLSPSIDTEWTHSTQQILESTISHSKPIPALERLRKTSKGASSAAPSTASNMGVRARRAAAHARAGGGASGSGNVGMMDVFAVMTQINEQLDAAADLESFLKVVTGVIKDLSQFHRVLVYQFDEVWNGQVVAELMDWSHSHDLFRGLHFPASDIPAQASGAVNLIWFLN